MTYEIFLKPRSPTVSIIMTHRGTAGSWCSGTGRVVSVEGR